MELSTALSLRTGKRHRNDSTASASLATDAISRVARFRSRTLLTASSAARSAR